MILFDSKLIKATQKHTNGKNIANLTIATHNTDK